MPARVRQQGGLCRGTARTSLGRSSRPLHHRVEDNDAPATGQARRSTSHSHRTRRRIPDRRSVMPRSRTPASVLRFPRRTLRMQLTLLYAGLFFVSGAALLVIPLFRTRNSVPAGPQGNASAVAQHGTDVHQQVISSAVALAVMVLLSLALGWLIAGRLLRPLRTITATARDISAWWPTWWTTLSATTWPEAGSRSQRQRPPDRRASRSGTPE